jgi:hypothetical protein
MEVTDSAIDFARYMHGTFCCRDASDDLEKNWINYALQYISLKFEDLVFREAAQFTFN